MFKTMMITSLLFVCGLASAEVAVHAQRGSNETYHQARARHYAADFVALDLGAQSRSAEAVKKPLSKVNIQSLPEVASLEELQAQFEYVRDTRFIDHKQFWRRLSWLYPDDGCFARAEMAANYLKERGFVIPKKLFVFGDLKAKTTNSAQGYVEWWYHVAAAYRVGNQGYVIDPALNPQAPMSIEAWDIAVNQSRRKTEYSICSVGTYDPSFNCEGSRGYPLENALFEQKQYLDLEWRRLVGLGRNPEAELGDSPPWH